MEIDYKNSDVKRAIEVINFIDANWNNIENRPEIEPRGWFERKLESGNWEIYIIMKETPNEKYILDKEAYSWFVFFKKTRLGL